MKKQFFLFGILMLVLSALYLFSCDSNEINADKDPEVVDENNPDEVVNAIVVKGITDDAGLRSSTGDEVIDSVAFTEDNIVWFNIVTREIKFKDFNPMNEFNRFQQLAFEIDGDVLFTAKIILPASSHIIKDIVLQADYDDEDFRYYLRNGYPDWASETEEALTNEINRAEGWNKFIERLRKTDRLKEDGDEPGPEPEYPQPGLVEVTEYFPDNEWNFANIAPNALTVIGSETELKNILMGDSVSPAIDFEQYILLVARISTTNGISHIGYELNCGEDYLYTYSMEVSLDYTMVAENRIIAVIAPRVPYCYLTKFELSITQLELTRINFETIQPWRSDIEPNRLYIIRSEEELETYLHPENTSRPNIYFEDYTVLLVNVIANSGIHQISYGLAYNGNKNYTYSMNVLLNETTVIGNETVAVLAPKISQDETVTFDFDIITGWE